ncbi:MAG: methyltransferase [Rhizobiaceae bacterium]|nr:MAG: methyltransferase [Rhizobiaceae bacterium]CAG1015489.1 hypothetical protein RHIZO_05078 [Rhizobiaceae bacterium]
MPVQDFTIDAFHRGRFFLVQPGARGHRAGMDAMMLAAAVPSAFAGRLADFGAGAGAAGLAVAARCEGASVVLIERAPEMAAFARRGLALPQNAGVAARASVLEADVGLTGKARVAAGLGDASFDFVIMNPPFNAGHDRATPDELKRQAHVMDVGLFATWIRSAAAVVRPRGGLAVIARPSSLRTILDAMDGRFGGAEIVAIHPRAGETAIRVVVRAVRASRAALSICPPLILHDAGDRFSAKADAINNGNASLFGD